MFRKLLRQQIRALHSGDVRKQKLARPSEPIRTYAQDTFLRAPPAGEDAEDDRKLIREIGRRVLAGDFAQRSEHAS
jgi:hypothetical protein